LVLYEITWKVDSGGRFMIEPKEDMMKRAKKQLTKLGSTSPDIIDAGSFTFGDESKPTIEFVEDDKPKPKTGILAQVVREERSELGI